LIWSLQYATWSISVRYLDLITSICHIVHQCEVPWSVHSHMPHGPSVWGTLIWSLPYATWSISVRYLDLITPVCHMVHQCEVPWSDHSHEVPHAFFFWGSLLFHLGPKCLPQCHIFVCCLCPSHNVKAQVSCPYKRNKIVARGMYAGNC